MTATVGRAVTRAIEGARTGRRVDSALVTAIHRRQFGERIDLAALVPGRRLPVLVLSRLKVAELVGDRLPAAAGQVERIDCRAVVDGLEPALSLVLML
jgi:hypothetical protein